jgi:protein SCO1/2
LSTLTEQQPKATPAPGPSGAPAASGAPGVAPAVPPAVRGVRIVRVALWTVLLLTIAGVIGLKFFVPKPANLPVLFPAAQFKLTDENDKSFSSDGLRGRPWIAAFVFTTCGDVCPRISKTMEGLQKQLPPDVQMVSFTVNPEHDTPAELKQYAVAFHADESRWHFLTGQPEKVKEVIAAMKMPFLPADRDKPILHSEKLMLIDAEGQIRGAYRSEEPEEMKQLAADAAALDRDAKRGKLMRWLSEAGASGSNAPPRRAGDGT